MKCDLCGCPVKVVGRTTQHYEIDIENIWPSELEFLDMHEACRSQDWRELMDKPSLYCRLREYVKARLESGDS